MVNRVEIFVYHPADDISGIDANTILKAVSGEEDKILPCIPGEPPTRFTAGPGDPEAVGKSRTGYQNRKNKPPDTNSWSKAFRLDQPG